MPADPENTDPADRDPREERLRAGSGTAAVSPWLIIGVIALIAIGVYVVSALL